jgi:2-alkyl-3-oxoalkanoate reductase
LRLEGGGYLYRAARAVGVHRYLQQSSGFFLKSGRGLADENDGLAIDATPGVAAAARTYVELETRVLEEGPMEGVALRYGFFYGPKTWYNSDGACAEQARRREIPIIGRGEGVSSFIHIEDAAHATVAALTAPKGIYHIVDDDPSPLSVWLPAFARWVGAPPPPVLSESEARQQSGDEGVYYATKLRGASNEKAKRTFGFKPRRLEFLSRS